jgi:hypothetical protein
VVAAQTRLSSLATGATARWRGRLIETYDDGTAFVIGVISTCGRNG